MSSASDGDPDLLSWLQGVAAKGNKRPEKAKEWYDAIRREDVDTLEELLKWTPVCLLYIDQQQTHAYKRSQWINSCGDMIII